MNEQTNDIMGSHYLIVTLINTHVNCRTTLVLVRLKVLVRSSCAALPYQSLWDFLLGPLQTDLEQFFDAGYRVGF